MCFRFSLNSVPALVGYYLQTFHFLFAFTGKSLEIGDGNKCRVSVPSSSWASNRVRHLDYGLLGAQKLAVIGQDRWIGLHPAGLPQGKLLWRQIRTKKTDTCLKGLRPLAWSPPAALWVYRAKGGLEGLRLSAPAQIARRLLHFEGLPDMQFLDTLASLSHWSDQLIFVIIIFHMDANQLIKFNFCQHNNQQPTVKLFGVQTDL